MHELTIIDLRRYDQSEWKDDETWFIIHVFQIGTDVFLDSILDETIYNWALNEALLYGLAFRFVK